MPITNSPDDVSLVLNQKARPNEGNVPGELHDAWRTDRRFRRFFDARPDLFEKIELMSWSKR
jgi:hypothetical protein